MCMLAYFEMRRSARWSNDMWFRVKRIKLLLCPQFPCRPLFDCTLYNISCGSLLIPIIILASIATRFFRPNLSSYLNFFCSLLWIFHAWLLGHPAAVMVQVMIIVSWVLTWKTDISSPHHFWFITTSARVVYYRCVFCRLRDCYLPLCMLCWWMLLDSLTLSWQQ